MPMRFTIEEPRRSTFVNVMSWLGLLSGAGATLSGFLMLFSPARLQSLGVLAGGIMAAAAAIGLRQRRNWARLSFIGVQCLAIVRSFVAVSLAPGRMMTNLEARGVSHEQAAAAAASAREPALIAACVFTLINVLIIMKLMSRPIREEFEAAEEE